jgi:hypothetical protein
MSRYETFGPYDLERDGHRLASGALNRFWALREEDSRIGLSDAVGVYVYVIKSDASEELTPWYVGRTDKQSFKKRFRQQDLHFRQVLEKATEGHLQVFLFPFMAPGGKRFRKPTRTKISHNEWLESMLIGSALSRNKALVNASKVKFLRTLVVPGYLNTPKGKLAESAVALKRMLDLD